MVGPDRRWSGARAWARDERFRLLMGRMTPGGLLVAGAGIAWQKPDLTGWLITGGLGLTGAGLEAWRTWLAYQYGMAEMRYGDQRDARGHELAMLTLSTHSAYRSARLTRVPAAEVTELARIEEAQDLWSTPVPERSASLSIDLRESTPMDVGGRASGSVAEAPGDTGPMPPQRRPRGRDRYQPR